MFRKVGFGTVVCCIAAALALADPAAFPGAEGFGRFATGGRGGSVYHVTNLNDSGPGSFRDAVSQSNRTVVFDIGGVINIDQRIVVSSNVTIAGQTAPGDGIVIYGNGLSYTNAHNSITRFIRIRMGVGGDSGKDAIAIARGHDMIFDHVSVSWGRDGTFDINPDSGYEIYNITIQDSIISQGLVSHSTGGLMQSTGGVSLLRNLWIDNNTRNPKVKGINEYVNNIVYNWDAAAYILGDSDSDSYANILNNYFIYGPNSGAEPFTRGNLNFHVYAADNYKDTDKDGIFNGSVIPLAEYGTVDWQTSPYAYPSLTPLDSNEAYYVVASKAGSYMPRDEVDQRLFTELTSLGTLGQLITTEYDPPMNGPGTVKVGAPLLDTDMDGMPDEWETAVGCDPNYPDNNGVNDGDGYTNLEQYLNWLAGPHVTMARNSAVEIDLRQFAAGFGTDANYSVSEPNNGSVTLLSDGCTARFVPAKSYSGLAGFRYTVDNGFTMSETINVLVTSLGYWVYGDFTGDDVVEMNDVPYFLDFWLEDDCSTTAELDLDENCLINFHEFAALANNWLLPPPDTSIPANILLGRPTDNSVTVNVILGTSGDVYFEYGTQSGVYTNQTSILTAADAEPVEVVIGALQSNKRYYYRMRVRQTGQAQWTATDEYSFQTQRAIGSTFTFTITADSHVNIWLGWAFEWTQTLNNIDADSPDFHFDLGDTFAMDYVITAAGAESAYLFQRPYFGIIAHSAPIFLVIGNHEQEEGWHLDDTGDPATSPPVIGTNARKKYFLNPVPDDFYSGNTDTYYAIAGDQLHEDYYSWEWGDALFVVINPYWYTTTKPYIMNVGGGEGFYDVGSGDCWDWTLGLQQYLWLKQTLENSNAKYKFVFSHQLLADASLNNVDDYGHAGANHAHFTEWGGYNEDGTTWGWDTRRPGWEMPIHQMLVENNVSAVFHGHDHEFAYEMRDGVVYQTLPSAGFKGIGTNMYFTGDGYTIQALANDGHLRVTVSPSQATVDYVHTTGADVAYSYVILPAEHPAAPTNFTAVAGNSSVTLDWADNTEPDLDGYNVYRSTSFDSGYVQLNTLLLNSSDYNDTAVVNDTMYYYVVTASDVNANESAYSQYACTLPGTDGNSVTIQENTIGFCALDGTVDNDNAGFTGAGFSNTDNAFGNGTDWSINIVSDGNCIFTWRYANGDSTDRPARLLVNSSEVISNISFPVTTDWMTWTTASAEVALTAGIKDIRLEATDANGLANIDYIRLTGPNIESSTCP